MYTAVTRLYMYNSLDRKMSMLVLYISNECCVQCPFGDAVWLLFIGEGYTQVDFTSSSYSIEMPRSIRVVRTPAVVQSGEESESVVPSCGATSYRLRTRREHKVDAMLIFKRGCVSFLTFQRLRGAGKLRTSWRVWCKCL